jgi:hypothetical protein
MTSPYLDRPLRPLAEALPRMLAQVEAELPPRQDRPRSSGSGSEPS